MTPEEREIVRLTELLRDVANCAPVMPDRRMGYVEVQIDWITWDQLEEFRKKEAKPLDSAGGPAKAPGNILTVEELAEKMDKEIRDHRHMIAHTKDIAMYCARVAHAEIEKLAEDNARLREELGKISQIEIPPADTTAEMAIQGKLYAVRDYARKALEAKP